jgi:hypothetical protein
MHGPQTERRRLLEKLLRELVRSETQTIEHAPREAKRIGETPPIEALRDVAVHVLAMRPRFTQVLQGHELVASRGGISATLSTLRHLVSDRMQDPERSYRAALLDLRHGVDVVRVLREVARLEELFALIRWCDDWLAARRTLVARVEAQLQWFAEQPAPPATVSHDAPAAESVDSTVEASPIWIEQPPSAGTSIAKTSSRAHQEQKHE